MREPKKRQGSVLSETGLRTRITGRDAENLSAEQGIAMHCLKSHATGPGDLEPANAKKILVVVLVIEGVEELVVVSSSARIVREASVDAGTGAAEDHTAVTTPADLDPSRPALTQLPGKVTRGRGQDAEVFAETAASSRSSANSARRSRRRRGASTANRRALHHSACGGLDVAAGPAVRRRVRSGPGVDPGRRHSKDKPTQDPGFLFGCAWCLGTGKPSPPGELKVKDVFLILTSSHRPHHTHI